MYRATLSFCETLTENTPNPSCHPNFLIRPLVSFTCLLVLALKVLCDSGHVGEDFSAMVFVGEIRFSIFGAKDNVIKELLMCAWHFVALAMSPLPGLLGIVQCLPVPHGTG